MLGEQIHWRNSKDDFATSTDLSKEMYKENKIIS